MFRSIFPFYRGEANKAAELAEKIAKLNIEMADDIEFGGVSIDENGRIWNPYLGLSVAQVRRIARDEIEKSRSGK